LDAIATAALSTPIVLAGGFTDEDVEGKIDSLNLFGIAMKGGDEIRPGYKDFDALADILEALEIDDLA
jgi:phosphoribosylanthranilate isomerase